MTTDTLRSAAWILGAWGLLSVVAAAVVTRLFRARARLNDQLAAEGRRADWAAAADGAEPSRR